MLFMQYFSLIFRTISSFPVVFPLEYLTVSYWKLYIFPAFGDLVQESRRDIGNLDRSTADLEATAKSMDEVHRAMAKKIQTLRDTILKAKQAASTLQISLSPNAEGICRRSYEPPIIPSSANTITLTYSTSAPERSSLLMYIGNPRSYALVCTFRNLRWTKSNMLFLDLFCWLFVGFSFILHAF